MLFIQDYLFLIDIFDIIYFPTISVFVNLFIHLLRTTMETSLTTLYYPQNSIIYYMMHCCYLIFILWYKQYEFERNSSVYLSNEAIEIIFVNINVRIIVHLKYRVTVPVFVPLTKLKKIEKMNYFTEYFS